ncbi:MAG TPA: hypothetical protein VF165_01920 [Nocardioidaceae bacterium]
MLARRRVKLAAVAAGAMTMLAGCGFHPGAAAVVGSQTITREEVDDVAQAFCSAQLASAKAANQPAPTVPTRAAREAALQFLLEADIYQQFGKQEGVEANPQQVSQVVAQQAGGLEVLPKHEQQVLRSALHDYAEGRLMLLEVGRQAAGAQASESQAMSAGNQMLVKYVKKLDVEVDPRYGAFENGTFKRGGASLSVAASDEARAGDKEQPDQSFVAQLPASQQCR